MNVEKGKEELLREAAACGDEESVRALVDSGTEVNAPNAMNGWTALHWASKRGHTSIVQYLLLNGANPEALSLYGESPIKVAKNEQVHQILAAGCLNAPSEAQNSCSLPITPNYLSNPVMAQRLDLPEGKKTYVNKTIERNEELVLKVRTSDPPNQDFIEIEIPIEELSYKSVLKMCCEELQTPHQKVLKLRKLPNTIIRKDKDVLRFRNFEELELVVQARFQPQTNGCVKSNMEQNSNYCVNGTILY